MPVENGYPCSNQESRGTDSTKAVRRTREMNYDNAQYGSDGTWPELYLIGESMFKGKAHKVNGQPIVLDVSV